MSETIIITLIRRPRDGKKKKKKVNPKNIYEIGLSKGVRRS